MAGFEAKTEAEAAEFTDELSDEALDRTEGEFNCATAAGRCW